MKIYRISYCRNGVPHQKFAGSDDAASKCSTELKKGKDIDDKPEREAIDIPTDKVGLIEWLNVHAHMAVVK